MCEKNETEEKRKQDYSSLQSIIDSFSKSITQSEAEVRSKLIVPIIEWLGYPTEYRAEEFPVYAAEGSKTINAKDADFLLFDDKMFASHRNRVQDEIDWVQEHSLLVFEAKKKGEMPELRGQAQFYTFWTKAVAYILSDGDQIYAYYYNPANKDYCILNCPVKDLPKYKEFSLLSFESIKSVKLKCRESQEEIISELKTQILDQKEAPIYITEENVDLVPDQVVTMMKELSAEKADDLSKLDIINDFFVKTDGYLQNHTRYNIPEYMMRVPRRFVNASIYLDNMVNPSICGTVVECYRNDNDEYHICNDFLDLFALMNRGILGRAIISYHIVDGDVSSRIIKIASIRSLLRANKITIEFENENGIKRVVVDPKIFKPDIRKERKLSDFWYKELNKMKCIEDYYKIHFVIKPLYNEELVKLYSNVDYVYNGVVKKANCQRIMQGYKSTSRIRVDEPILIESADETRVINLPSLKIYNYNFIPKQIYLPAGVIQTSKRSFIVDFCAVLEPKEIDKESSEVS